jgi:hypothetical protein
MDAFWSVVRASLMMVALVKAVVPVRGSARPLTGNPVWAWVLKVTSTSRKYNKELLMLQKCLVLDDNSGNGDPQGWRMQNNAKQKKKFLK